MVTTAARGTGVDRGNDGASLFRLEVCDRSLSRPLGLNRQYAAILSGARYVLTEQVLHETADRRQATVSSHSRVATLGFDVLQESQHVFGLHVVEIQIGNRFALMASQEQEEQLQCIAVGPYSVAAGSASGPQIVEEEALGQDQERNW